MFTVNIQFRKHALNMQLFILLSIMLSLISCASPTLIYTSSADSLIEQGMKAEALGNMDDAERAYFEAAKLSGRGNMYLGNLAYGRQDFATAEHQYRLALRDVPDNASLYNNLAWSLLKQKHKLKEAEELAMLAVQRSGPKTLSITWETLNTIRKVRSINEAITSTKIAVKPQRQSISAAKPQPTPTASGKNTPTASGKNTPTASGKKAKKTVPSIVQQALDALHTQ